MRKNAPEAWQLCLVGQVIEVCVPVRRFIEQQLPVLSRIGERKTLRVPFDDPLRILVVIEFTRDEFAGLLGEPEGLACVTAH